MADNFNGTPIHFNHRDVTFTAISRAPFAKIEAYRKRMGWRFPWVSSYGSDFNFDYHVTFTAKEIAAGKGYCNYGEWRIGASDEVGISVFAKNESGEVPPPTPVMHEAPRCSMAPITILTSYPRVGTRTASTSRWRGYAGMTSIEPAFGRRSVFHGWPGARPRVVAYGSWCWWYFPPRSK